MNKYILPLFALIVVAALVWYATTHPRIEVQSEPTTNTAAEAETITDEGAYYTIEASYPKTTGLPGESDAAAVALMKAWVEESAAQFKTDSGLVGLTSEDATFMGLGPERKLALGIEYEESRSAHTLSYLYSIYSDTGGAHPNLYFHTFTFDTATGKALALGDLFQNPNYLQILSSRALADLPGIIKDQSGYEGDADYIGDGAAPTIENFSNFFFSGTDFIILFPPYQVGPYALGPVTLRIPTADLKANLKAQYP